MLPSCLQSSVNKTLMLVVGQAPAATGQKRGQPLEREGRFNRHDLVTGVFRRSAGQ